MARVEIKGGAALKRRLAAFSKLDRKDLRVGFLEDAKYPDGTSVPMVAAIQNYGAPAASIPARPFFTNMVETQKSTWGGHIVEFLQATKWDLDKSMNYMGQAIGYELKDSIRQTNEPPLSPITLMLRMMRKEAGLRSNFRVTGKMVGEAARRVAKGEVARGINTKVLNDTAHMQNSIEYQVEGGNRKRLGKGDE